MLNEMNTIVIEAEDNKSILLKQIAGAVARRIITYAKPGTAVEQGDELGFIRFGSRVDILLPTTAVITVKKGDYVKAGISEIATW